MSILYSGDCHVCLHGTTMVKSVYGGFSWKPEVCLCCA